MGSCLDAALSYAAHSRRVFPVKSDGSKAPLTPRGFKDATTDEHQIRSWWGKWPDAWIGMPTGSGLFVLDADPRNGGDIGRLENEHGRLPETRMAITPSGGSHTYLLGSARNGTDVLGPGLDIRGEGGYVILPPSPGYRWVITGAPETAPEWLLGLLVSREERAELRGYAQLELGDIPDGKRNDTLASWAGLLLRHYVDMDLVAQLIHAVNLVHCKDPKSREEVDGILDSVARMEADRRDRRNV